jgi:hypothetical protein
LLVLLLLKNSRSRELPLREDQSEEERLVVQDDIEQGTVNAQPAIILKESQLAELSMAADRGKFFVMCFKTEQRI